MGKRIAAILIACVLVLSWLPAVKADAAEPQKLLSQVNKYDGSGNLVERYSFHYNGGEQLIKVTVEYLDGDYGFTANYNYAYNKNGQLLSVVYDSGPMSRYYEYNSAGQVIRETYEEGGLAETVYTYDRNGNVTKEVCDYGYGTTTTEHSYNNSGLRTASKTVDKHNYDNMTETSTITYTYDDIGRRTWETTTDRYGTRESVYVYDYAPFVVRTDIDTNGVEGGTFLYLGDPFGTWLFSFQFLSPFMYNDDDGYLSYVTEELYFSSYESYLYEFSYIASDGNPFVDVDRSMFCYDAVLWAYTHDITTGKDATHFDPSGNCTRAQVVTFLWRAAGEPEPRSTYNPFPDVSRDKYYYKAVLWAVDWGITSGFKDGTFGPNKTCTRDQIVTFLWRYASEPRPSSMRNPFPDVDTGAYYGKAVLWAVEQGITGGFKDGTFGPNKTCKRDQIVTFLFRFI